MRHYFHHFLIANVCLYITYLIFGSITIWEIMLFIFMTFIPLLDELFYVAMNYVNDVNSRGIVNLFLVGELSDSLYYLHKKRNMFYSLILHNMPFYLALCAFLYVLIIFDQPVLFYPMVGLIVHITLDIINDQYEFGTIRKWFWPILDKNLQVSRVR
ncbi:hypothetical protein HY041_00745 [Candidatus Roizmanbacteria bacterium]|nr:hypothetical protein [Candidatus Roizmanbacteria bacterium]